MANQAKQRFVALRVHEVSLVDRPANEEEFLVIKRHPMAQQETEKSNMNAEKAKKKPAGNEAFGAKDDAMNDKEMESKAKKAEGQDSEPGDDATALKNPKLPQGGERTKAPTKTKDGQQYAAESDLTKAKMKDADGDEDEDEKDGESAGKDEGMDEESKKAKAKAAEKDDDASDEDNEEGDYEKSKKSEADLIESCKAMMTQISSFFDHPDKKPAAGGGGEPYKASKNKKVEKAACGPMDEVVMGMLYKIQDMLYKAIQMQSMDMSGDAEGMGVEKSVKKAAHKGARHMTPDRMEMLKSVHGKLVELMKDLQPPQDPSAGVTPITPDTVAGKTSSLGNGNGYKGETGLTDLGSTIAKAISDSLKPVTDQIAAVSKRLETVENVKGVSKAMDTDETEKPVEKAQSFWSGVL